METLLICPKDLMIGNFVKINKRKNIGIHMSETKMRNADFDGDEINIHVMQGVEARVEALTFANVQANIPSALNNGAMIGMMQNSLSGAFILTRNTVDNIDEMTQKYLNGEMLTTMAKGARRAKYYLNSAGTGAGKSRTAMGHACRLAYPFFFDIQKGRWIETGASQKVLFISTELDADEDKESTTPLFNLTVKVYEVPLVKPVTDIGEVDEVPVIPLGFEVAI
jgi:hypothetical protein